MYNYELVDYKNSLTKVKIICLKHGIFEQTPSYHLSGHECITCYMTNKFVNKSKLVHKNKYDYSSTIYLNKDTNVKILCKRHGIFEQTPTNHLTHKHGCQKCSLRHKIDVDEIIERANKVHNFKYDYSLINYSNMNKKIKIICKNHGIFEQIAGGHLRGQECPFCKSSKGEKIISDFLLSKNISYIPQYSLSKCRYKNPLEFDFFIPINNLIIEYDGIQHFKPIEFFGGEKAFQDRILKDQIKNEYCLDNDIKLIRISYKNNIKGELNKIFNI
jgi:hypothetical protein